MHFISRIEVADFLKMFRHTLRFTATDYYVKVSLCPMSGFKQNNIFLETSRKFYIACFNGTKVSEVETSIYKVI